MAPPVRSLITLNLIWLLSASQRPPFELVRDNPLSTFSYKVAVFVAVTTA